MVFRVEELLAAAGSHALSFVLVIPAWKQVAAWQQAHNSEWHTGTMIIPAAAHGYCDGAQHQRRELYRPSSYDTAIVVMQNPAGAKR